MLRLFPRVKFINQVSYNATKEALVKDGFHILEIDGEKVFNETTFFKSIIDVLPLNPPLSGNVHYDAFTDSLWGGLDDIEGNKVAILWTKANIISQIDLNDLSKITQCFIEVAQDIRRTDVGAERPKELLVFLFGEGKNFLEGQQQ